MIGYKERTVNLGAKSEVYYNLHKQTFSMKQDGLVVLHSDCIILQEVTFKVSESGRQRVLKEKRKNVHAYVIGKYVPGYFYNMEALERGYREAYYNPYKVDSFVDKETMEPLHEADVVILKDKRIFYK